MLPALVATVAIAGIAAAKEAPQRAKARYYYLEGARHHALNEMPEAYEYYKMAYLTDPTYVEAASSYGTNRLMVKTDTLQTRTEMIRSLDMMRQYVDKYKSDLYESRTYAFLTGRLGYVGEAIRIYERIDSADSSDMINLLQLADAYMAAKQEDKALATLDRFEVSEGKSPQLSMKKMSFMLASGDTVAAINEANSLIQSNPREPSYRILKGNLFEVVGNNDSTLKAYLEAEKLSPDNGTVKLALASFYKNAGDSAAYDNKVYEALLSEDFILEDKLGLLAEYLQTLVDGKNDTSRGDHLFSVIMEQFPHEPEVLDLAARYSGAKGNYAEAAEQISYAIDLNPNNLTYWGQLMRFQLADDKPREAMATYKRAITHVETSDAFDMMYASAATMAKDWDEAEKTYAELIHKIDAGLPITDSISDMKKINRLSYDDITRLSVYYNLLGDMYYSAGSLDKTFKAYDNSLFLNPSNAMTLNNYAYFLAENNGDLDKAIEMSKKAVEMDAENDTYLDTYAWVLFKKKEYVEALEYQRLAIEAAEKNGTVENAEFFSHLGDILFMNSLPQEALESWKKALELAPDDVLLKKKVTHKTFFYE